MSFRWKVDQAPDQGGTPEPLEAGKKTETREWRSWKRRRCWMYEQSKSRAGTTQQEFKGYWVVTNSFSPNPALQYYACVLHVHKELQSNGKEKMGCRLRGETGCSWRGKKWKHNLCISDFSGATYPNFYKRGTYKYSWADQGAAFSGHWIFFFCISSPKIINVGQFSIFLPRFSLPSLKTLAKKLASWPYPK